MIESSTRASSVGETPALVEREARIVGIKDSSTPTFEALDRRRSQLWTIAFSALVSLSAAVALLSSNGRHDLGFANGIGFRIGTIVLVVALAVYVVEKERHLRRLAKLLVDERVRSAAASKRAAEHREPLPVPRTVSEKGHIDTESALSILYEAEKALRAPPSHQEVHDTLTGAANEVLINDRLTHALARLKRTRASLAVLFIDIDDFKLVNGDLGVQGGDMVLSAFAQRLSGCLRLSDTVGRIGGDEFVVICEDLAEDSVAGEIANRILREVSRPFSTPAGERSLSASIGIAMCDADRPMSAEDLVRAADGAMYRAKMCGKGRVERV